jgi:hypothetical protein
MSINEAILSFNAGELSPKIDTRVDVEKYRSGCRRLENMIPTKYGGAERRPGLKFIQDATTSPNTQTTTKIRMIPFVYSKTVAYVIEVGAKYMRFYYGSAILEDADTNVVWIDTPYLETHIFELKFKQIADVMWICHPNYAPRKLSRTGVYTFELTEIDFRKGPFLLRNDLIDPVNPSNTTMSCNVTAAGSIGILTASNNIFLSGHIGALFKLIHPRTTTLVEQSGAGTSDAINVKGTFSFVTHGTWTGTVYLQRSDNLSDWENFRTYKGSADRNVQLSHTEEEDNIRYRINTDAAGVSADISLEDSTQEGIVKILNIINGYQASVEVYADLAATSTTRRWAEGAWSASRGYPGTVTFFEDRCVYGGASIQLSDNEFSASTYPILRA